MRAENKTTEHNRTIRVTGIPGEMPELVILVDYAGDCNVEKAVVLDGTVIPAIIDSLNGDTIPMSVLRGAADATKDLPSQDKLSVSALGDSWKDVSRIVVEGKNGLKAIAFISVRLERGRPKFQLTVKKGHHKETSVCATLDWVI
jgi:hypothetical protein